MIEHSPITPEQMLTEWNVKRGEYDRLNAELRSTNKAVVFDALTAAGITIVTVSFDGYGDSGQIEDIDANAGEEVVTLPPGNVEIAAADWNLVAVSGEMQVKPKRTEMSIRDGIEHLAYAFLEETHDGWENNNGAYGNFVFDVDTRTITLDYNARRIESDYSQHVF
jgi:hypothetical protein